VGSSPRPFLTHRVRAGDVQAVEGRVASPRYDEASRARRLEGTARPTKAGLESGLRWRSGHASRQTRRHDQRGRRRGHHSSWRIGAGCGCMRRENDRGSRLWVHAARGPPTKFRLL
jgi:hypothetical protein